MNATQLLDHFWSQVRRHIAHCNAWARHCSSRCSKDGCYLCVAGHRQSRPADPIKRQEDGRHCPGQFLAQDFDHHVMRHLTRVLRFFALSQVGVWMADRPNGAGAASELFEQLTSTCDGANCDANSRPCMNRWCRSRLAPAAYGNPATVSTTSSTHLNTCIPDRINGAN